MKSIDVGDASETGTAQGSHKGSTTGQVRRAFGEHDVPSTLLGVAVLGYGGQLVDVEAVAALR
jgi:hypothetical protein